MAVARALPNHEPRVTYVTDYLAANRVPGTTDDSAGVSAAFSAWLTAAGASADNVLRYPGVLVFPPGTYRCNVTVSPTVHSVGGQILGYGARILPTSGALYGLTFDTITPNKQWRNLTVNGLELRSCGIKFLGRVQAGASYGITINDVRVEDCPEHGIMIAGPFESSIMNCRTGAAPTNTTGDCIHVENDVDSQGGGSGVEIINCTTRSGRYGVYSQKGDTCVIGGSFLEAQFEGIYIDNGFPGAVYNVHVENNYMSAASQAAGGPGVTIVGRGTAVDVRGICGSAGQKQKYAVDLFIVGQGLIVGGLGSNLVNFARLRTSSASGAVATLINTESVDYGTFETTGAGQVYRIGSVDTNFSAFRIPNEAQWYPAGAMVLQGGSAALSALSVQAAWLYDAAAVEAVTVTIDPPRWWKTFAIDLHWANFSTGVGDVMWSLEHYAQAPGATVGTATTVSVTATPPATAGQLVVTTIVSSLATLAAGQYRILRLLRAATDVADTLPNDAALYGIRLRALT